MSILAAIGAATTTHAPSSTLDRVLTVVVLVSIPLAILMIWVLRVFRRGSIYGPVRLTTEVRIAPMLVITAIAGGAWLFSQIGYFGVKAAEYHKHHPDETFEAEKLGSDDFVFLSTVPASVGFALLIIGDLAARQDLPRRLGYSLSRLPRGSWEELSARSSSFR